jgi:alkylation response protein AidB-like acyl-CoA dehydrogenase
MTDGAARLLSSHIADPNLPLEQQRVFREAYKNLISRDPARAWTSGQWMTERSGGSDVKGTETVATLAPLNDTSSPIGDTDATGLPLGPYSITGFKWFSSATDANMAILLARTPAGISTFFAPMRRCSSECSDHEKDAPSAQTCEMNGIIIQRLKQKLGTRPLPTAELVLKDTRAWILGKDGQGVREISAILNITRIHTAQSALGFWGRGLAISRSFARVRKVDGGKLLMDIPAHVKTIAGNTVNYAAMMHLGFFAVTLLGICEHPSIFKSSGTETEKTLIADVPQAAALLRLLTPVAKAQCSKLTIFGLQECMESLGGVGYMEDEQEFNIARLYRDANVLSIWEGTTEVMAVDVVRVMKGREGEKVRHALNNWVNNVVTQWGGDWKSAAELVRAELGKLEEQWLGLIADELKFKGRELLNSLAWIVAAVLTVEDACRDQDIVAAEIARRWIAQKESEGQRAWKDWKEVAALDRKIVFGCSERTDRSRL